MFLSGSGLYLFLSCISIIFIIVTLNKLKKNFVELVGVLAALNLNKNLSSNQEILINVNAENATRELIAIEERTKRILENMEKINAIAEVKKDGKKTTIDE